MKISVIAPVFNEQDIIPEFYARLIQTMQHINMDYEVILVDDGSTNQTPDIIRRLNKENPRLTGLHFSRNFGHQAALAAGLAAVTGDVAVLMDSDLQDPPECIPNFLDCWKKGYHVVYAVRIKRKESVLKRLCYVAFYRMLKYMSNIHIPLDSGDFALIDRQVVDEINALPERNRFLRGLRAWIGFQQIGIPVERHARSSGKPGYTIKKLFQLASDGVFSFSWVPLRLLSLLGLISIIVGLIYFIFVL
jgi:polyisoprenyl-phosphate glycosyltransferase